MQSGHHSEPFSVYKCYLNYLADQLTHYIYFYKKISRTLTANEKSFLHQLFSHVHSGVFFTRHWKIEQTIHYVKQLPADEAKIKSKLLSDFLSELQKNKLTCDSVLEEKSETDVNITEMIINFKIKIFDNCAKFSESVELREVTFKTLSLNFQDINPCDYAVAQFWENLFNALNEACITADFTPAVTNLVGEEKEDEVHPLVEKEVKEINQKVKSYNISTLFKFEKICNIVEKREDILKDTTKRLQLNTENQTLPQYFTRLTIFSNIAKRRLAKETLAEFKEKLKDFSPFPETLFFSQEKTDNENKHELNILTQRLEAWFNEILTAHQCKEISHHSPFYSLLVPARPLKGYLDRFQKYADLDAEIFIYMAMIVDQYLEISNDTFFTNTCYQLIATSLLVANKYLAEAHMQFEKQNQFFANLSGMSLQSINACEKALLTALNYNVSFSEDEFNYYKRALLGETPALALK